MRSIVIFAAAVLAAPVVLAALSLSAEAAPDQEQGRKYWAIAEAGAEYCPNIKIGWGVRPVLAEVYGLDAQDEIRSGRLDAEMARMFRGFRTVSSRSAMCAELMNRFGPGGSPPLFEWR